MSTIDLNADLGEGGAFDLALLDVVSSCNIACGGHAGDAASMRATVRAAMARRVALGAHPAYPDRDGFGRQSRFLSGAKLRQSLAGQMDSLVSIVASAGGVLAQAKPHGALYADAARDTELAELFVDAVQHCIAGAAIVGPPGSALQRAAERAGGVFVGEAFVDRAYLPSGELVPRSEPGAVHADFNTMTAQAVSLATQGVVTAQDGSVITIAAATLCIHGDTPAAAAAARAVRDVLQANGVEVRAAV